MSRWLLIALGLACLPGSAIPARGQGLLDELADAIDEAMDEGGYDDGYDYEYYQQGPSTPSYWNQGQGSPYRRVWNGSSWVLVPVQGGNAQFPSAAVYPQATVAAPTVVVPNALPYRGPGVTIKLEKDQGGPVSYLIDGRETATIQAGQQQTLTTKGRYEVRFSRGRSPDGRDLGEARYTITEGAYHFAVTDKGWELFRDQQPGSFGVAPAPTSPSGLTTNALPAK